MNCYSKFTTCLQHVYDMFTAIMMILEQRTCFSFKNKKNKLSNLNSYFSSSSSSSSSFSLSAFKCSQELNNNVF